MKFYPIEHKYVHKNKTYTSCTTLTKKLFPKFKKSKISKEYAIKNNLRKKDVLKKWKLTGTQASTVGTIVHEIAEDLINKKTPKSISYYKKHYKLNKEQINKIKELTKNVKDIIPNLPVGDTLTDTLTEQILWDEKALISGTVDLIVFQKNVIWILDWKTSKTITRVPFIITDTDVMGFNIPHANYYHYSMQMAVYQHLMHTTPKIKKKVKEGVTFKHAIIHIPSKSIIEIPDNEITENQTYVQSILKK